MMNRETLIKQLRHSARDAASRGFVHWHDYMSDAADMLEGKEPFLIGGAPVVKGEGEGPTLTEILVRLGITDFPESFTSTSEAVAKATRVYRFDENDPETVRFFDHYENARNHANTLKYSLVGFDPVSGKWSVDELEASYG